MALEMPARSKSEPKSTRYISFVPSSQLVQKSLSDRIATIDHGQEIGRKFWGYCKKFLEASNLMLRNFSKEICKKFFKDAFARVRRSVPF